jgi:hypothetical protein
MKLKTALTVIDESQGYQTENEAGEKAESLQCLGEKRLTREGF